MSKAICAPSIITVFIAMVFRKRRLVPSEEFSFGQWSQLSLAKIICDNNIVAVFAPCLFLLIPSVKFIFAQWITVIVTKRLRVTSVITVFAAMFLKINNWCYQWNLSLVNESQLLWPKESTWRCYRGIYHIITQKQIGKIICVSSIIAVFITMVFKNKRLMPSVEFIYGQ